MTDEKALNGACEPCHDCGAMVPLSEYRAHVREHTAEVRYPIPEGVVREMGEAADRGRSETVAAYVEYRDLIADRLFDEARAVFEGRRDTEAAKQRIRNLLTWWQPRPEGKA